MEVKRFATNCQCRILVQLRRERHVWSFASKPLPNIRLSRVTILFSFIFHKRFHSDTGAMQDYFYCAS